ncbi:hypothetical protein [Acholeplasma laidlawii]|uniref:Uncharacterized protein n=3 Tax=Acholeplasma laidlawii TaxID=2148 RepID=A0A553II22_ACHLA|nr:hypothetical protein [Acholeplasma laidlawii]NWH11499.1 hypothetical protein [Acholeplasma laidlawii]NWH13091.1 hypothetical protein [Acholeplasma laidlawii]NWH14641.1 hypothetical protein [Acholeplasma laidlawii]OAN19601.1 hypothetical protein A2I99_04970 [Acholeplasma laidlawii]PII02176.1 hypothetical protein B9P95_000425 [Acholeplasma laidlawii]
MFDGPVSDQLKEAKDYLKNEIYSSLDFQDSMIPRQFSADLFGYEETLDEIMKKIDAVSNEDIMKVLTMMTLTTTYTLSGGEDYEV